MNIGSIHAVGAHGLDGTLTSKHGTLHINLHKVEGTCPLHPPVLPYSFVQGAGVEEPIKNRFLVR